LNECFRHYIGASVGGNIQSVQLIHATTVSVLAWQLRTAVKFWLLVALKVAFA
jgi:hypothetical protein